MKEIIGIRVTTDNYYYCNNALSRKQDIVGNIILIFWVLKTRIF